MAKLVLINPSYRRTYGSAGGLGNPIYPVMSLAALAGAARREGHQVSILDLSYRNYDPDEVRRELLAAKPDVVGITATTPLANQMRDLSFLVKDISPDILTVAGGPHPTALPEETLRQSALDLVCYGEGDLTIVDIMAGTAHRDIKGVVRRDGDQFVRNAPREMIGDLDTLAMPAWDLYDAGMYREHVTRLVVRRPPASMVEFSRGCVFRCDFCASKNTMGMGYRKKSPARCAEEMLALRALGYREVILADDIFTSDNAWAIAVCEEFIRRGVDMAWTCTNGIRVDSANSRLFQTMKKAGCYRVHFGFESGNDAVLKNFGKGGKATLDQGITAVDEARKVGLDTFGMFMLGLSGDDESTMQDTIDYAKRVKVDAMRFGICVPFPGTQMFDDLKRQNNIQSFDWDLYTVYNDAKQIYRHPKLDWDAIGKAYHRSHIDAYLKNPSYILRRLIKSVTTGEIFWDIYYFLKFLKAFGTGKADQGVSEDRYAYRDMWEPLGTDPDSIVYTPPPVVRGDKARR